MKKTTRNTIIIILIGGALALIVIKLSGNKKEVEAKVYRKDPNLTATVQADTIAYKVFSEKLTFLGAFAPSREVTIASETTGKVIKVGVQEGSTVQTGSLIAQLDTEMLQAQLSSAQATWQNAATTLRRYEQAASGVTQLQIDNARTQLLTAKAQIDQLEKQIRMCTIQAPFPGVITSRKFDLGAILATGVDIAQLTDINKVKLEINVPESSIGQFKKGQAIPVVTDIYGSKAFTGIVDMVAVKADASRNYLVKIVVDNNSQQLKAGMYGRVAFEGNQQQNTISVPRSSLVGSSKEPQVFVIENGIAKLRNIETGFGNETHVEVTKGLTTGEVVAIGGLVNLTNNSKVTIAH